MNCPTCQTKLAEGAKFCNECGSNVELSKCKKCDKLLKPDARFCQNCGEPVKTAAAQPLATGQTPEVKQSWLNSFGSFLFIPVFAGIIVLLFWVNKEPEPLGASNTAVQEQSAPDMAAMVQVHETLERLKKNLDSNSNDGVSMDSLAIMYTIAGSHEKALTYYEMHLEIEPDNKDLKIALGLTYHNLKRSEDALAILQEVLTEEPTNAFALHYLAEIQSSLHNHEEAEKSWQKIIAAYPNTEMAKVAEQRIHETMHEDSNQN